MPADKPLSAEARADIRRALRGFDADGIIVAIEILITRFGEARRADAAGRREEDRLRAWIGQVRNAGRELRRVLDVIERAEWRHSLDIADSHLSPSGRERSREAVDRILHAADEELALRQRKRGRSAAPRLFLDGALATVLKRAGVPLSKGRDSTAAAVFKIVHHDIGISGGADPFAALKRGVDIATTGVSFRRKKSRKGPPR